MPTNDRPAGQPLLRIEGLTKSYGATQVLKGVDLEVARGEVVTIIGPSGSGKTTLLRCVNFLETYQGGSIRIDGEEVGYRDAGSRRQRSETELARIRAETGMVFQSFNLFPHLTAAENVMLGLVKVRRKARAEARSIAAHWLGRVGLGDKLDRRSSPAGSSSASASPGPWPWTPRSCCSTKSPPRLTPSWSARCWTSCCNSPGRA